MSRYTLTPFMKLRSLLKGVSKKWFVDWKYNFNRIDSHDHSLNKGKMLGRDSIATGAITNSKIANNANIDSNKFDGRFSGVVSSGSLVIDNGIHSVTLNGTEDSGIYLLNTFDKEGVVTMDASSEINSVLNEVQLNKSLSNAIDTAINTDLIFNSSQPFSITGVNNVFTKEVKQVDKIDTNNTSLEITSLNNVVKREVNFSEGTSNKQYSGLISNPFCKVSSYVDISYSSLKAQGGQSGGYASLLSLPANTALLSFALQVTSVFNNTAFNYVDLVEIYTQEDVTPSGSFKIQNLGKLVFINSLLPFTYMGSNTATSAISIKIPTAILSTFTTGNLRVWYRTIQY